MRFRTFFAVVLLAGCTTLGPPRSDDLYARVLPGMTRGEVERLIGVPDNTMAFPASGHDSWGYFYFDTWGYYCEFSVTFGGDGIVASKVSRRINDGGDHGT
jgi:outer membrane protein assembly factor BamE (lipoprotein component of BamABCDE complex)